MTDGRTDGRMEAIAISPSLFKKKRGDNKCGHKTYRRYALFSKDIWACKSVCGTDINVRNNF